MKLTEGVGDHQQLWYSDQHAADGKCDRVKEHKILQCSVLCD